MNIIEHFLNWPIKVAAIAFSIFYGLFAVRIFLAKNRWEEFKKEHFSWWINQFWLNFLGSLLGWIVLYFLLRRVEFLRRADYSYDFSFKDVLSLFVSFVGITGHLPMTIIGIVNSITALAGKIIEVISKWLVK